MVHPNTPVSAEVDSIETQIAAFPSHVPIRTLVIRNNRFGAIPPPVSASCEAALATVFASPALAGRFQHLRTLVVVSAVLPSFHRGCPHEMC